MEIILLTIVYFAIGGIIVGLYGMYNSLGFPFEEGTGKEESCKMILVFSFWPLYLLLKLIKGIIWFVKHLFISLDYFYKKYFKKKDKNTQSGKFKSLLKK